MQRNSDSLRSRGRTLESLFFRIQDAVLIEKQKELARMEMTRKSLSEATGITSPQVLQNLVELEISAEEAAALAIVPLVEVAWADGELDSKERKALLAGAVQCGIREGSLSLAILTRWLTHKPSGKLFDAWTHYIKETREFLSEEEQKALKDAIMKRTRAIALASGGFLGLTTKVSPAESNMLGKLDLAFD